MGEFLLIGNARHHQRRACSRFVDGTAFAVPRALPEIVVAVPDKDYKVKEHKGARMRHRFRLGGGPGHRERRGQRGPAEVE